MPERRCRQAHPVPLAGKLYRVAEVLDWWIEVGEWWSGEPETVWYRVQTHDRGVFELYRPTEGSEWRLWKVVD